MKTLLGVTLLVVGLAASAQPSSDPPGTAAEAATRPKAVSQLRLCVLGERLSANEPFIQVREVLVNFVGELFPVTGYDGLLALWLGEKVWPEETLNAVKFWEIRSSDECGASAGHSLVLEAKVTQDVLANGVSIRGPGARVESMVRDAIRVIGRVTGIGSEEKQIHNFPIYFVTPRDFKPGLKAQDAFGNNVSSTLSFGSTIVGVPHWPDMNKAIAGAVKSVETVTEASSIRAADSAIVSLTRPAWNSEVENLAKRDPRNGVLIFVHGYNTSFVGAISRAAQLAYDLAWPGAVVVYSWPSNDAILDYKEDARDAVLSVNGFAELLGAAVRGTSSVTVIAHSMGNRVMLPGLKTVLTAVPSAAERLRVVMAAPDVPRDWFNDEFDDFLASKFRRITLYANSNDAALEWAPHFKGLQRIGIGMPNLMERPYLEAIDASNIAKAFFGLNHSYFGDSAYVLNDIFRLVRIGEDAKTREAARTIKPIPTRKWSWEVVGK